MCTGRDWKTTVRKYFTKAALGNTAQEPCAGGQSTTSPFPGPIYRHNRVFLRLTGGLQRAGFDRKGCEWRQNGDRVSQAVTRNILSFHLNVTVNERSSTNGFATVNPRRWSAKCVHCSTRWPSRWRPTSVICPRISCSPRHSDQSQSRGTSHRRVATEKTAESR